jgi:hypothetical protein
MRLYIVKIESLEYPTWAIELSGAGYEATLGNAETYDAPAHIEAKALELVNLIKEWSNGNSTEDC